MSQDFETSKNVKAGTITGVISGGLFLIFFLVSWSAPVIQEPVFEEGLEVNLGIDEDGSGDVQPLRPGPPSAAEQVVNTPPRVEKAPVQSVKAVETDDNDKEAPDVSVPKPKVADPKSTTLPTKENTTVKKAAETKPQPVVENPQPAPPKPKATYKGGDGSGPGGNNADSWNNSKSEGNTTGSGDRGKIDGDPNSKNYDGFGGSGNGSYTIQGSLKGRAIVRQPTFRDEFNENAKVAVDLSVDASGAVTAATYQPRGSTTSNATMKEIALRKARELKFGAGDEQRGTIIFNFRVTN
ncbi:MAG: hypothetical protein KIT80_11195 [Chitinophagaceae bacterium]|nr:hypothetical protein [Chitinophagaceae bacterium]MCW5927468.1 hypothetical protein [Chitinophagaceae bacterium]